MQAVTPAKYSPAPPCNLHNDAMVASTWHITMLMSRLLWSEVGKEHVEDKMYIN